MNLLDIGAQLGAPPLTDHVIKRLIRHERNLAEIKRALDEVNRKVDTLLYPNANRTPEFDDPFAPGGTTTLKESWPSLVLSPYQLSSNSTGPSQILIQDGPLDFEEFNMLGVFKEDIPRDPDFDLVALSPTLGDLYTLSPRTLPASMVFRDGVWADPPSLPSRTQTRPLSPATPGYDTWCLSSRWGEDDNFPGGGINDHQPTEQWADVSAQRAEASTSLAAAKPNFTENSNQSESSSPSGSSLGGGYDRRKNTEEISQRLAQICEALGIPSTGAELSTLQEVIKLLGGAVPKVETPTGWIGTADRRRRKRGARRACYEELQRLVGPPVDRLAYAKVLDNVLENVGLQGRKVQSPEGTYDPYGVFRLGE